MDRYTARIGAAVTRELAEQAMLAARQEAERAAAAARDAMLEAQSANRAKTEFLATMSHELRTPLNAIIGFSEMMVHGLMAPDKRDKHLEYARDISGSGRHLLGLINDILDVAKIEAGKLELEEDTVRFSEIAESCVSLIRERIEEKNLTLNVDAPAAPVALHADELKLKQVVINLLSNAAKFTEDEGRIDLGWRVEPDGRFRIRIGDTGIGIAAEHLDTILEPFTQVNRAQNTSQEGTGLGLPLSKALIELHDGTLTVESRLDAGTTVTVWLPADRVTMDAAGDVCDLTMAQQATGASGTGNEQ